MKDRGSRPDFAQRGPQFDFLPLDHGGVQNLSSNRAPNRAQKTGRCNWVSGRLLRRRARKGSRRDLFGATTQEPDLSAVPQAKARATIDVAGGQVGLVHGQHHLAATRSLRQSQGLLRDRG